LQTIFLWKAYLNLSNWVFLFKIFWTCILNIVWRQH
jgi:hypothetical protein